MDCLNLNFKDNRRLVNDFGEINVSNLLNEHFVDKNPNYDEFIANKDVLKAIGALSKSESNKVLGTSYGKEISESQSINLKKKISLLNNSLFKSGEKTVYMLFNNRQIGQSYNFTWGLRKVEGRLNVNEKIERAKEYLSDKKATAQNQINYLESIKDKNVNKQSAIDFSQSQQNAPINSLEFNKKLESFFNNFGISFKEGDSSVDILRKIAFINPKTADKDYIDSSAKLLIQLLQASPNINFENLQNLIEQTDDFKKSIKAQPNVEKIYDYLKAGNRIPMNEWVSYIAEYNKIKNAILEKTLKESLMDAKSNTTDLHKFIDKFLQFFKDLFSSSTNIKEITDAIISQVLVNNKEIILGDNSLQGKEKVTLEKALKESKHGENIIRFLSNEGLTLVGSVAVSEQGSVYRKLGHLMHDIDWVVPYDYKEEDPSIKLKKEFNGTKMVREFDSPTYYTKTYIVPPKGYTVVNMTFFRPNEFGENKYIAGYDVVDSNGKVVSNYRRYYNVKEDSNKATEDREIYNEGLTNVDKNLNASSVDFFYNKEEAKYPPLKTKLSDGTEILISNWLSAFTEKLKYGRNKDLVDWVNFIPNDFNSSQKQQEPEVKPGVQELFDSNPELANIGTKEQYSQYIDSIFPDSQVKDILKHTTSASVNKFKKGTGRLGEGVYLAAPNYKMYDKAGPNVYRAIVNISNVKRYDTGQFNIVATNQFPTQDEYSKESQKKLQEQDKAQGVNAYISTATTGTEYNIFESEQIHILGNKQDIEGFKEFVGKKEVKPVQKGPAKSNESGQMKMFQLKEAENKRKQMTEEAKQLLYQYAKVNGIKIEFIDQVLDDNGNDIVSFYDNVKKVIQINKNLADDSTLPEELGHHLSLALGLDHVLIKRALNLIGRLDYKNLLGQDYVDAYEGNTDLLKLEYLGKLISKQISNPKLPDELKSENGVKIWETIKNAVKAFIKRFNGNNNLEQELDNVVNELSSMINSGKNVNNNGDGGLKVKMWQINNNVSGSKTDKKSKLVSQEYRSQYIYFKRRIVELERKNSKIRSEASKTNSDYRNNVVFLRNVSDIAKIQSALVQAVNENNQLELMELSYEIIDNIKTTIDNFGKTNNPDLSKLDKTLEVLNLFSNYGPVKTDVYELKKNINKYLVAYAQKAAVSLIGKNVPKEVFEKEFIDTDINFLEKGFGTLASVQNYVAKTAGLLIKKYQAIEEQENRASYEKISAAVEKLTKYAKNNGIPLKNMYDIFIQNFKNTTVLTKEFNSDFYNLIQKIYEDKSKDPSTAIKKIATYDANRPAGDRWVPKNRTLYDNKEYKQIRSTPELWAFYNFFKDTMKDLNDNSIPIVALNENFIPNMREKTLMSIFKSDDSFQEKFKGSISNILGLEPFANDESKDYLFDSDLMKNQIPLKYLASISADSKSKNLGEILLRFSYFANSYKNMNEVLPQVNLLKEIVDNQEFIKSNNDNSVTSGSNTNTGAIVQAFIDMQVLGKKKNTDTFKIGDTTIPAGALIDWMMKYTSLLRIGLNPFNAVSNVAIGNVSNIIEAVGGRHFNVGGYMKALSTYTKDFASSKSKTNMLSKIFNPLIEMDDYENLAKLKLGSQEWYSFVTNRERLENLMYAPQRHGERQLQTSTMIAIFRKQKVTTKSGESISMWEAFDENGVWNESLMGYKLSNDEIFKMTSKIHAVNKMIHGRYSAKDAAALTQNAYFRAVFQFKKWIPAAIEARIGGKRSDNILGDTEGRYHTLGRKVLGKLIPGKEFNPFVALYNLAMPLIASEKLIKSGKFTETDVYNMRKNMSELIIIAAIMLFKAGFDDDDKKKKASYKYTMRILSQLSKDVTYFYDPQEGLNLLGSGAPILKTAGDIRKMLWTLPAIWTDDDEINRGRHKNEDPFYAASTDLLPLYKPLADFGRLWNTSSYQEIK